MAMVTRSLVWLLMEEHELWPVIAMLYLKRGTVHEVSREHVHSTIHPVSPCYVQPLPHTVTEKKNSVPVRGKR